MKKRNAMIEAFRGLACLLVVFCHFDIKNYYGTYVISLARFAVPFFLILSGYYALKPTAKDNIEFAKKKLIATVRLLIIGTAICVVSNSIQSVIEGNAPFKWFTDVISLNTLLKLIVFNRAYWLSSVMYYLFMMVYVYIAYILLNKLNLLNIAYYFIPILLLINIVISKMNYQWYYVGNFFFTGFPFFMLGNFINKKNIRFSNVRGIITAVAAGVVLTFIENYIYSSCYCFIGTVILSTSLFLLGLHCSDVKVPTAISNFGSQFSMWIFLLHCPVGYILRSSFAVHGISLGNFESFVVIITTVLVCLPVVLIKRKQ